MSAGVIYYAIGDIHGELDRLQQLHKDVFRHHREHHSWQDYRLVHLGDYVDRGPDSAGVVNYLMALDAREEDRVMCLKGNHEAMMVDALRHSINPDWWCDHGGTETLDSYRARGMDHPPEAHLDWLDRRPTHYHDPDRRLVFVHAAINIDLFPDPDERQHLWGRTHAFFDSPSWSNPALSDYCVIHGHTPTDGHKPDVSDDKRRINVDTGAVYGGVLTAVGLAPDRPPIFLSA
ncbi:metallophosphoesterase family protein [Algimonas porphyrae]|uniref:Serine/threonine protein phosphatase n=1 Tax=Algimonas porphyrae TaxID=1128113 RepID=A0ABQ5V156_9PROT|nr:metallophosphoesterase family protein [Algimonas porphyrae]GLQ21181.1 serine/threonine protein phosphatase [Algimonas porphyrae]